MGWEAARDYERARAGAIGKVGLNLQLMRALGRPWNVLARDVDKWLPILEDPHAEVCWPQ